MTTPTSDFAQDVLRLTNDFRAEHNLSPLALNQKLTTTAQKHSQAMAEDDFFSHIGKDNSTPWERAETEGYTARAMAENIAAGQRTPEQVVQGWIDSPGHRENLLNPSYTELGVGYFELSNDTGAVNYMRYWTQLFGSGDLTQSAESTEDLTASQAEETLIQVLTLTEEGTLQLSDRWYRSADNAIPSVERLSGSAAEPVALIQVDSQPALIDLHLMGL